MNGEGEGGSFLWGALVGGGFHEEGGAAQRSVGIDGAFWGIVPNGRNTLDLVDAKSGG